MCRFQSALARKYYRERTRMVSNKQALWQILLKYKPSHYSRGRGRLPCPYTVPDASGFSCVRRRNPGLQEVFLEAHLHPLYELLNILAPGPALKIKLEIRVLRCGNNSEHRYNWDYLWDCGLLENCCPVKLWWQGYTISVQCVGIYSLISMQSIYLQTPLFDICPTNLRSFFTVLKLELVNESWTRTTLHWSRWEPLQMSTHEPQLGATPGGCWEHLFGTFPHGAWSVDRSMTSKCPAYPVRKSGSRLMTYCRLGYSVLPHSQ